MCPQLQIKRNKKKKKKEFTTCVVVYISVFAMCMFHIN